MSDGASREEKILRGVGRLIAFLFFVGIWIAVALGNSDSGDSSSRSSRSVSWDVYDVEIGVREDGTLHVVERQEVRFSGTFTEGFARIPLARVESIENVRVTAEGRPEDTNGDGYLLGSELEQDGQMLASRLVPNSEYTGEPGTHRVIEDGADLLIEYGFESTGSSPSPLLSRRPQVRTIVLEYDVRGAIRAYPDAEEPWQQLHWMAISSEVTDIARIQRATVTISLPEAVAPEDLVFVPESASVTGRKLAWPARALDSGDQYDVQVAFPAITTATAPAWQPAADQFDAQAEARENRNALGGVMLIAAGLLALVGGGLCLLYAWYTRIREPALRPEMDIVPEPPADLPAGLVGALVDEQVHPRDVAATVLDLDRRGVIRIVSNSEEASSQYGAHPRYALELRKPIESALGYEQVILRAIFGDRVQPPVTMSFNALRPLFGTYREAIQSAIDEELVRRGYYVELPARSRRTWELFLKVFLGLSIVASVAILVWIRSWTWLALVPPLLGVVVFLVGRRMTPTIARKTPEGAEVAGQWRAFQRYLEGARWSSFVEERATIHEQYMPWVLAFGINTSWLREMNTAAPGSARSASYPSTSSSIGRGGSRRSSHRTSPSGASPRSDGHLPTPKWRWDGGSWDAETWSDLQSGSDSILGAMQNSSDGFFSMLGDAMEALGSSSGGSGGGSSSGRSSWGSSRSGGGRSRSSSGGGSRGFR